MNKYGKVDLFKCVYGSKLYGTDTPASDTDYKTVFLPSFQSVLLGKPPRTKVRTTSSDKVKNNADDVDEQFVPFQTFAREFFEGQTYALELAMALRSGLDKLSDKVQYVDPQFKTFVRQMTDKFLHNDVKAMVGYAWNQAQKYQLKGRRFKALEEFAEYLKGFSLNDKVVTFMEKAKEDNFFDGSNYFAFDSVGVNNNPLAAVKVMDKLVLSTVTISELVRTVNALLDQYGHRSRKAVDADVDWKSLYHAVRVAFQARDLLKNGYFDVPYTEEQRTLLLAVKTGQLPFEQVTELLGSVVDELDELKMNTKLQPKTEALKEEFEEFLFDWLVNFYELEAAFLT